MLQNDWYHSFLKCTAFELIDPQQSLNNLVQHGKWLLLDTEVYQVHQRQGMVWAAGLFWAWHAGNEEHVTDNASAGNISIHP